MDRDWAFAFNHGCSQSLTQLLVTHGVRVLEQHSRAPFVSALFSPNSSALIKSLAQFEQACLLVDVQGCDGKSALWLAIGQERPLEVVSLLRAGANPNQKGPNGFLPTWFVAWQGQAATLESLVLLGGRLVDPTHTEQSILGLSIESANLATFTYLLSQPSIDVFAPLPTGLDLLSAIKHLPADWAHALNCERKRRQAGKRCLAWHLSFPGAGCPSTTITRL